MGDTNNSFHTKKPTVVNHQTVKVCSLSLFEYVRVCVSLSYICPSGWQTKKVSTVITVKGQQVSGALAA